MTRNAEGSPTQAEALEKAADALEYAIGYMERASVDTSEETAALAALRLVAQQPAPASGHACGQAEELVRLKAAATEYLDADESLAKIEHFTENLYNRLAARMREEHVPTPEEQEQAVSRLIQARLDLRAALAAPEAQP